MRSNSTYIIIWSTIIASVSCDNLPIITTWLDFHGKNCSSQCLIWFINDLNWSSAYHPLVSSLIWYEIIGVKRMNDQSSLIFRAYIFYCILNVILKKLKQKLLYLNCHVNCHCKYFEHDDFKKNNPKIKNL